MTELLPCPFCGGEAMHLHTRVKSTCNSDVMLDYDVVDCSCCRASTRSYCDNKEGAIKAWNTRPQSPAPEAVTGWTECDYTHAGVPKNQWLIIEDADGNVGMGMSKGDEDYPACYWTHPYEFDYMGDAVRWQHFPNGVKIEGGK